MPLLNTYNFTFEKNVTYNPILNISGLTILSLEKMSLLNTYNFTFGKNVNQNAIGPHIGQVAQNDLCQKIVNLNEKYIQDHENGQSDEDLSRHQSHDDLLTMGEELIGQLNGNRAFG
eukprot:Awhi_evm1s6925